MPKSPHPGRPTLNRSAKRPQPPVRPLDTNDVVLTPGGGRPRKLVHILKEGQHVSTKGGRVRIIDTASGEVVKDLGESGKSRSGPDRSRGPKTAPGPVPSLPDISWIQNSQFRNGDTQPIVYFSTTWVVPPVPSSSDSQTIFLFNAMQPDSGAHILQPVLQWGGSAAGGGAYWSITNWYADGQGGASTTHPPIKVSPGDVLQGVMTCTGQSDGGYDYKCSFVGYPSVDVTVTGLDELTWIYETLEAYGATYVLPVPQCSDYPDTPLTAMYDIEVRTGTPGTDGTQTTLDWVAVTNFTDCGQQCVIVSNDSPGGAVYLYYNQPSPNLYFVIDKGTFGKDEVLDVIAKSGGVFRGAFFLALEGFTLQQLTIDRPSLAVPTVNGAFTTLSGVNVALSFPYQPIYDPTNLVTPQRILYPFDVTFTMEAVNDNFPSSGITPEALGAEIVFGSTTLGTAQDLTANTAIFLVAGAAPYFTNVDPEQGNVTYLSQDLRVFTVTPTANQQTPIASVPFTFQGGSPTTLDTAAAYHYIQNLIRHFNSAYTNPGGVDPFDPAQSILPDQTTALTGDSTVTPATANPFDSQHPYQNYNFALARVRLRGSPGSAGEASDVRVFFRLFTTQTFDTDYINTAGAVSSSDPNITFPSLPAGSPNAPTSPLPGTNASGTINGSSLPFFAAVDQSDLAPGGVNLQTIEIPSDQGDRTWAYFGCFLNVYDETLSIGGHDPQYWLPGSEHCCLVAQIASADAPIENVSGIIETPGNSSLLAQRNLQVTPSGNPGFPATHLIPQTFDARPSPAPFGVGLSAYPDELMIDWRNTPIGSTAQIYWPQVNASAVLKLAADLYPAPLLSRIDDHTIGCTVGEGYSYVPIPRGGDESFAGLFTLQLPAGIRAGQSFDVIVRRLTSRRFRFDHSSIADARVKPEAEAPPLSWRYVVGTFQMQVPVQRDAAILPREENLLAILKWRLQRQPASGRWYPILQRWIGVVSGRVRGFGGDPGKIAPSQYGTANQGASKPIKLPPPGEHYHAGETGKISALRYDRFGDFIGFDLITLAGEERHFRAREQEVEERVRQAWVERILLTVVPSRHDAEWPGEIIFRGPPRLR